MKTVGIVAEYNPLHNGHLYHINQTKKLTGATHTVCVMSGNFVQRGEPSIIDKWQRTKLALNAGIDLVLELPFVYAVSSAEYFAYSAVKILDSCGVIDNISFGSELGSLDEIKHIANILANEPDEYKLLLKNALSKGVSYPKARMDALVKFCNDDKYKNIISYSNNILAIEYIKALNKLHSSIEPVTVKRLGSLYTDTEINALNASATAIRMELSKSIIDWNNIKISVPDFCMDTLSTLNKNEYVGLDCFESILLAIIRKMSPVELSDINEITEGLENKFKKAAHSSENFEELILNIKSKRYTRTKIMRILCYILTNLTKKDFNAFNVNDTSQYIRVLGFNKNGKELLTKMSKVATLPIISKPTKYVELDNPLAKKMFEYEIAATDLYVLGKKENRKGGQEFSQPIVIV